VGAGDIADFQVAGKTLFSTGLVKESEGNLSTFDGRRLRITRTGARLAELGDGDGDVVEGTLDQIPEDASSDAELHIAMYLEHGPGAVAHDHVPGSVPDGWVEGEPHGRYAFGVSLEEVIGMLVSATRENP
jgi:ribulose-5-phosphate 4-epimerase/fuculose-1-phosphate aldolase